MLSISCDNWFTSILSFCRSHTRGAGWIFALTCCPSNISALVYLSCPRRASNSHHAKGAPVCVRLSIARSVSDAAIRPRDGQDCRVALTPQQENGVGGDAALDRHGRALAICSRTAGGRMAGTGPAMTIKTMPVADFHPQPISVHKCAGPSPTGSLHWQPPLAAPLAAPPLHPIVPACRRMAEQPVC